MLKQTAHLPKIPKRNRKAKMQAPQYHPLLERLPTRIRAPPLAVTQLTSAQRLRREKTFASATTAVGRALDEIDKDFLSVSMDDINDVLEKTNSFIYAITHRINKNRHNLKFGIPYYSGPADDGLYTTQNYNRMNLYLPMKLKDVKIKDTLNGYSCVQMSRNPSYDRFHTIRSDNPKNYVSPFKVSQAIHELMSHICPSVGRGSVLPFFSNNSDYEEGTHQIVIILDDYIRLTVIPTVHPRVLKKDEDGTILIAKPYLFDHDPNTDTLWRYDNPTKAKQIVETMNKADRSIRSKCLRLLHICSDLDPKLRVCPLEFVTMVVYDMFDEDVDQLPSWQNMNLEQCFLSILTHWHQHMLRGSLCHPFTAGLNILSRMPEKNQQLVKDRITRLLSNKRELVRLLKLR